MITKPLVAALAIAFCSTAFSYQTANGRIMDSAGNAIQLRGVNWFGFDTTTHVVHGLWAKNWKTQIQQMQDLGFNAVRLPFCPGTLRGSAPNSIDYSINPDLINLSALQIMDKIVRELDSRGFRILLDHHTPDCATISELWYTPNYSEAQWLSDLQLVATQFAGIPGVIGIDLKNEPHGAATWGTGQQATDWNLAAERAAAKVMPIAPHWLMFVEGVADAWNCASGYGHGWGGNLEPMNCTPLKIPANRLVLAPHAYGPDVYNQSYFNDPAFPGNMPAIWEQHFGQFAKSGYPVVLGEFGGKYGRGLPGDVAWQNAMVSYMIGKKMTDSFYWSWNPNSGDTGGILNEDWTTVRTDKMDLLKKLWTSAAAGTTAVPATAASGFKVQVTVDNDWGSGYCAHVDVTNSGVTSAKWNVTVAITGKVNDLWNAVWTSAGSSIKVSGFGWNESIAPNASAQFGFCAVR